MLEWFFYLFQGLCEVLDAASKREAAVAQQTEMLLNALFPHVSYLSSLDKAIVYPN